MITQSPPIILSNQNLNFYSYPSFDEQVSTNTSSQQILSNMPHGNKTSKSHSNLCSRCSFHPSQIQCLTCKTNLCQICNFFLHNSSKFSAHEKKPVLFQEESVQSNFMIRITEANQGLQNQAVKMMMQKIGINQKWDKILKHVQKQFQAILELIVEKKNFLIGVIDKKREEEIQQSLKQVSTSRKRKSSATFWEQNFRKSQKGESHKPKQALLQTLHLSQVNLSVESLEVRSFLFNEIKILVEKLELKSILNKPEQEKKLKSRRQTHITSNATTISSYSSVLGSPKNIKSKLSQFSFMDKLKKTFDRLNEEETDEDHGYNQLKLMKAKSQKYIVKQKNSESVFYENKKK